MATGESMHYVAGAGEPARLDLPRATGNYRNAHQPQTPKPTGLDWVALTPTCRSCGTKSTQLADGALCPTCRGVQPETDTTTRARTTKSPAGPTGEPTPAVRRPSATTPALVRRPHTSAAGTGKGKPTRQPTSSPAAKRQPARQEPTQETTVTSPPFPTYIVDIAIVMRDTENHHDDQVRAARKDVANALMRLNRELLRYGSPTAQPAGLVVVPKTTTHRRPGRPSRLDPHHTELLTAYAAGATPKDLGKKYGVSDVSVRKYLIKHGIRLRTARESALNFSSKTNPTGASR